MQISLKAARVNAGYTQQEVCDKVGMSKKALIAVEKGIRDLTLTEFDKLCRLYGCDRDDIILPIILTLSENAS